MENRKLGTLYVVATPIGNLEDITLRAIRILSEVDMILCENTLHTLKLLNRIGVKNKLYSHHSYNEERTVKKILERLEVGSSIALVSDSGTPCISDPGSLLISLASRDGHRVIPIPGPSAFVSLLSISGFPTNNFIFIGFLSPKKGKREKKLSSLTDFDGNIVLYESPHRIDKLIPEIAKFFKGRDVVIGRELTKKFEEVIRSKAECLLNLKTKKKGEYTIVINNFKKVRDRINIP